MTDITPKGDNEILVDVYNPEEFDQFNYTEEEYKQKIKEWNIIRDTLV